MKAYRIGERSNSQRLWQYLTENGRILLPMVELPKHLGWRSTH